MKKAVKILVYILLILGTLFILADFLISDFGPEETSYERIALIAGVIAITASLGWVIGKYL